MYPNLAQTDPEVFAAVSKELARQREKLELIAITADVNLWTK